MQYKDIESFPDLSKKSLVIALNETSNILFQKLQKETKFSIWQDNTCYP